MPWLLLLLLRVPASLLHAAEEITPLITLSRAGWPACDSTRGATFLGRGSDKN
jgi:hypothetical protein